MGEEGRVLAVVAWAEAALGMVQVAAVTGLVEVVTGLVAVAREAAKTAGEEAVMVLTEVEMVERKRTPSALLQSCICPD